MDALCRSARFFQQRERKADLQKLEAKKKYYQDEIQKARKTLTELESNPAALEKFARERYLMKKMVKKSLP